jgi:hypothetical protein
MPIPHFNIPLNLPHAATVAERISKLLERGDYTPAWDTAEEIYQLLEPSLDVGQNPPDAEALPLRDEAAAIARRLVGEIQQHALGNNRLGQCVRNLFECLELGEEGARLSLLAGEDPNSLQRPV